MRIQKEFAWKRYSLVDVTCYMLLYQGIEEEKNIASNILLCMYTLNGKQYNEGEILCT